MSRHERVKMKRVKNKISKDIWLNLLITVLMEASSQMYKLLIIIVLSPKAMFSWSNFIVHSKK